MPDVISSENAFAIVGHEDVVLGFKALGFYPYSASTPQEFKTALEEIIKKKTTVCLVQDNLYRAVEDQIKSYRNLPLPIFVPFSKSLETDLLDNIVKDIRIKATGAF